MPAASLVFPHQLFADHPALNQDRPVYLVEDPLFFGQLDFHPLKRVLHRASIKAYQAELEEQGHTVHYVDHADLGTLEQWLQAQDVDRWHWSDPCDYLLERRLKRAAPNGVVHSGRNFLLQQEEALQRLKRGKRYHQTDFYQRQRKAFDILMEGGEPVGGKWTYDTENRKKMPKGLVPPQPWMPSVNEHVKEAVDYVQGQWPGQADDLDAKAFPWPVTRSDALRVLEDFVENRLHAFGDYQDALDPERPFLFHSLLTPALNIGLLEPMEVLQAALDRHAIDPVPINALEGFVRQILGWREYLRAVYVEEGVAQRTRNYWGFEAELPAAFAEGKTGWPPVDDAIRKVNRYAYAHHIERLMVLGNVLLLTETHPDAVYAWFMARFIDAYDWVMVPNVYGMSQYADGGLITTKPYLSGSNYIRKQSHYKKGDWCAEWDALYWRFVWVHREVFADNPRMSMMARLVEKMDSAKRKAHLDLADAVLSRWRGGAVARWRC